jgi:hypothetical protein
MRMFPKLQSIATDISRCTGADACRLGFGELSYRLQKAGSALERQSLQQEAVMALDSDLPKPVAIPSDQQGVPEHISASHADGTPSTSAEIRQLDTTRPRSARRRGPRTAAGKARVATNAIAHAMSSARLVVLGEGANEWEAHRRAIVENLAPEGPVETALAERVASAIWRWRRVSAYEEAAIAERQHSPMASARLLPSPLDIDKVIRYEAHLTRELYKALHELEAMRAERRGRPMPLLRVDTLSPTEALAPIGSATS